MADAEPPPFYEPPTPFAQQRSDLRAGIGRRIGDKLDSGPRMWRLCSGGKQPIQLYIGDAFLDVFAHEAQHFHRERSIKHF